ncbi:MAG: putative integral rane protein, partial [Labilithrix sp.]|nr:putative integral rane protein [Labilithrix sp.]
MRDGVIDEEIADRLRARVAIEADVQAKASANETEAEHEDDEVNGKTKGTAVERGADVVVSGAAELFTEMGTRWQRLAKAIDEDAPPREENDASLQHDDRTLEAGRAIFAREGHGAVVGAGVEALAALDDDAHERGPATEENKPFGALQVFWFIGTILVLAGSVMGVREAWRTLEGVWRPLVIAGAFFAYHVLFVGLARLLVKRSVVTGRVLAGISAGLLPIVFVAAAVAIGQQSSIGVPFAALLFLASTFTSMLVGRVASDRATGLALTAGLAPSLLLELVIGTGGALAERRAAVVLVALVPLAVAATRARVTATRSALVSLGAAAYGAVAVGILGLYGGPGDPSLPFEDGGIGQRALVAWLALSAAIAWWASSGPALLARLPRMAAVPFVLSLAVLVSTSAAALLMGLRQSQGSGVVPSAIGIALHVPLAVLVLATVVLSIEQRTRPGALHVAVLVALGTMVLVAKTIVPDRPELWPPTCAAVPACFLSFGAFVSDRRRRAILATWGIVAAIGTLLTVLGVEAVTRTTPDLGQPWKTSAITALVLALSAHAGARTTRPSLHLAGAAFAFVAMAAWLIAPAAPLPPTNADATVHTLMLGCAGLAALYGVIALGYEAIAPKVDERRPLDDASLLLASGAVWLGVPFATRAPLVGDVVRLGASTFWLAMPPLALALVLFLRSVRDRSALVSAQGAVALALAAHVFIGATGGVASAWLFGGLAGAFAIASALRSPKPADAPKFGRALHGVVPL